MEISKAPELAATSPKHLRVGINAAMVEHTALARILIDKGIISRDEYLESLATTMEEEKARFEKRLSDHFGFKVVLA